MLRKAQNMAYGEIL
jgi:hypothetical protein